MEPTFNIWKTNRQNHLGFLEHYSLERLNTIPQGFSNNLIWNVGHIIAVQQRLLYKACGLPMHISDGFFDLYKPGSKPTTTSSQKDLEEIKMFLIQHIEMTEKDFKKGLFTNYHAFKTQTGFQINSIEDAIEFNNYHEGLHLGFMMNIRKFI